MMGDFIKSPKAFIKQFEETELSKIYGDIVAVLEQQLMALCINLFKVKVLFYETSDDILNYLTLCCVTDFKELLYRVIKQ